MIEVINIKGFKSILDDSFDLLPLTVLTGLNSSGKSSIIQALRILGNVAEGKTDPLLEGHGSIKELTNEGCYQMQLSAVLSDGVNISFDGNNGDICSEYPNIIYVSADRKGPRVSIPMNTSSILDENGDNVVKCIEDYNEKGPLPDGLNDGPDSITSFSQLVEYWLKLISPNVSFQKSLMREIDASCTRFNNHRATNVGFGLSYTLPIIVAVLIGVSDKNSIVIIENPEAHIHPQGQTNMASLICKAVDAGAQIVVETHSDHLVDGMRVYTRRHNGFSSKLKMYWLELDEQNRTKSSEIRVDDNGRYCQECPKGFFDQFEINASNLLF